MSEAIDEDIYFEWFRLCFNDFFTFRNTAFGGGLYITHHSMLKARVRSILLFSVAVSYILVCQKTLEMINSWVLSLHMKHLVFNFDESVRIVI